MTSDRKTLWAETDAAFLQRIRMQAKYGRLDARPVVKQDILDTVFQLAPNAIEWLTRSDFIGNDLLYHYKRSYQIIRDFFQLRCPLCNDPSPEAADTWDKPRSYLESEVLLVWSEAHMEDVCPKCRVTRSELSDQKLVTPYNGIHLVVGMRSGKSVTIASMATYMAHWLICRGFREKGGLPSYFGLGSMSSFEFGFVAASKGQSEATVWSYFQNGLRGAPWYRRFREWILNEQRKQPPGEKNWVFSDTANELKIGHPLVRTTFVALATNSETGAGRTRIGGVDDEMGRRIQNQGGKQSSEQVYGTLADSLTTVKAKVKELGLPSWIGSMMSCTSRRHRDSYEIVLYNKREELPTTYMMLCPTWEFNPDISLSDLHDEFVKNYPRAMLHFGCVVVEDEDMLIESIERFVPKLVRPAVKPTMRFAYSTYENSSGDLLATAKIQSVDLSSPFAAPDAPRVIAIDNGQSFDCLTMCCAHGVWAGDGAYKQFVTVIDWMVRLVPADGKKARLVAVMEIVRGAAVHYRRLYEVRFDRWESAMQIELLRDDLINATPGRSPTAPEMRAFAGAVEDGRVWAPMPSPDDYQMDQETGWFVSPLVALREPKNMSAIGAAVSELTRLKDDGVKVYNPDKGRVRGANSDDAALTMARAHTMVQKLGHVEDADSTGRKAMKKRSEWQAVRPDHTAEIWRDSLVRRNVAHMVKPQMPLVAPGLRKLEGGGMGQGRPQTGYGPSAAPGIGLFGAQMGGALFGGGGPGRGGGSGGLGGR